MITPSPISSLKYLYSYLDEKDSISLASTCTKSFIKYIKHHSKNDQGELDLKLLFLLIGKNSDLENKITHIFACFENLIINSSSGQAYRSKCYLGELTEVALNLDGQILRRRLTERQKLLVTKNEFQAIANNSNSFCSLSKKNKLFTMARGDDDGPGFGSLSKVPNAPKMQAIAMTENHIFCLDFRGKLWLERNSCLDEIIFRDIEKFPPIKEICAGKHQLAAITGKGDLFIITPFSGFNQAIFLGGDFKQVAYHYKSGLFALSQKGDLYQVAINDKKNPLVLLKVSHGKNSGFSKKDEHKYSRIAFFEDQMFGETLWGSYERLNKKKSRKLEASPLIYD